MCMQVELYTVDSSVKEIVEKLVASDMRFYSSDLIEHLFHPVLM